LCTIADEADIIRKEDDTHLIIVCHNETDGPNSKPSFWDAGQSDAQAAFERQATIID
jgi:hypothetical protein